MVFQQGNALQCYQPSRSDALNITLTTAPGATTLTTSVSHVALSKTGYTEYGVSGTPDSGVPRAITVSNAGSAACGVSGTPTLQNMRSDLVDTLSLLSGNYWSSTEAAGNPVSGAWYQIFSATTSNQIPYFKLFSYGVRCSRALTL